MKIAIFTLTKDRLDYTKQFLKSLKEKTYIDYDHFIIDQNSTDGTVKYLLNQNVKLYPLSINIGINRGVNYAIERIEKSYNIIVKMDNDIIIETDGWLSNCINVLKPKMLLSPYVKGLIYNRGGVPRFYTDPIQNIGYTPFIGGICMIGHNKAWNIDSGGWTMPVPRHAGGDRDFCMKLALQGYCFGYKENIFIRHNETTIGQYQRYPKYFESRKQEKCTIF